MSSPRLFGAQSSQVENRYQAAVLAVIDNYVAEISESRFKGAGLLRAEELKLLINTRLTLVEKLSDTQLMWRICDYVDMENGVGPLGTSKTLRSALLTHLCHYLKVSLTDLDKTLAELHAIEMRAASSVATHGVTYVPDAGKIRAKAEMMQVKQKLAARSALVVMPEGAADSYMGSLFTTIDEYKTEAAKRYFTREGRERADAMKVFIETHWFAKEKLNDQQIMSRMCEHLALASEAGNGLLGSSRELRAAIVKGMCQFLHLNEEVIKCDVTQDSGKSIIPYSSLGPIAQIADDGRIALRVRLRHIHQELSKGVKMESASTLQSEKDDIELQRFAPK